MKRQVFFVVFFIMSFSSTDGVPLFKSDQRGVSFYLPVSALENGSSIKHILLQIRVLFQTDKSLLFSISRLEIISLQQSLEPATNDLKTCLIPTV